MSTLLVWREKLQKIYASYSIYILKVLQFLTGLLLFGVINFTIGYMEIAASPLCTAGLAAICTFFPVSVLVLAAVLLVLLHFYALSLPIAGVAFVVFLLMYIFYFRFTPKSAWLVVVSALAFALKIPFVIPVTFGLLGTTAWVVPAACGAVAYYMTDSVRSSAAALKTAGSDAVTSGIMNFTKQMLSNKEMWVMVLAVVLAMLVVNAVHSRPIDHAWKIASAAGAGISVVTVLIGNITLSAGASYTVTVISAVLGAAAGLMLEFFFFCVDYSRTENIQFEDDEYYYYVKAVPKIGVSAPEKTVKHITERQALETLIPGHDAAESPDLFAEEQEMEQEQAEEGEIQERNTDEILLTRSLSRELGLDQDEDQLE